VVSCPTRSYGHVCINDRYPVPLSASCIRSHLQLQGSSICNWYAIHVLDIDVASFGDRLAISSGLSTIMVPIARTRFRLQSKATKELLEDLGLLGFCPSTWHHYMDSMVYMTKIKYCGLCIVTQIQLVLCYQSPPITSCHLSPIR